MIGGCAAADPYLIEYNNWAFFERRVCFGIMLALRERSVDTIGRRFFCFLNTMTIIIWGGNLNTLDGLDMLSRFWRIRCWEVQCWRGCPCHRHRAFLVAAACPSDLKVSRKYNRRQHHG
ncbi:hypothetical protein VTJ04DRAFT_1380 [Mycothermus thermophilus]|uniref:uncharacterized protein n=1 Tax=Humicola insolens TaxID=85995 RepID=UPI003743D86C